jgi:hypothetical protein
MCTALIQGIRAIFRNHLLTFYVFREVLSSKCSSFILCRFRSSVNEIIHIKLILSGYLHTHPFYSSENFWCLKITHILINSCAIGYVISVCTMKAYRRSKAMTVLILNLDTRWKLVVSTTPMALYMCKETYSLGGWVGLRAYLNHLEKKNIFCHCWVSKPSSSNLLTSHPTDFTIPALYDSCV